MRRRTKLGVLAGGATAAIAGGAILRGRVGGRGQQAPTSFDEESQFTLFAPGGPQGWFFNGPVGWAFAKFQPISHAGLYGAVAEVLDLKPEDELLDIGCGPGAFLATKARHARSVVGLDVSPVMLHEAERRLADRLAAGTARLVLASSAALPFGDGEFSAVTAITAPANLAEIFRVLRPGGRFVYVDELVPDPRKPSSEWAGGPPLNWTEADFRRIIEDAGFADVAVRYMNIWHLSGNRIVGCRKRDASRRNTAVDIGGQQEWVGSAANA